MVCEKNPRIDGVFTNNLELFSAFCIWILFDGPMHRRIHGFIYLLIVLQKKKKNHTMCLYYFYSNASE